MSQKVGTQRTKRDANFSLKFFHLRPLLMPFFLFSLAAK